MYLVTESNTSKRLVRTNNFVSIRSTRLLCTLFNIRYGTRVLFFRMWKYTSLYDGSPRKGRRRNAHGSPPRRAEAQRTNGSPPKRAESSSYDGSPRKGRRRDAHGSPPRRAEAQRTDGAPLKRAKVVEERSKSSPKLA